MSTSTGMSHQRYICPILDSFFPSVWRVMGVPRVPGKDRPPGMGGRRTDASVMVAPRNTFGSKPIASEFILVTLCCVLGGLYLYGTGEAAAPREPLIHYQLETGGELLRYGQVARLQVSQRAAGVPGPGRSTSRGEYGVGEHTR